MKARGDSIPRKTWVGAQITKELITIGYYDLEPLLAWITHERRVSDAPGAAVSKGEEGVTTSMSRVTRREFVPWTKRVVGNPFKLATRFQAALALCLVATIAQAAGFRLIEVPADADSPAHSGAMWYPCSE